MEKSQIAQAIGVLANIRPETGEYLATLHAWGELPQVIPVQHAARLLAALCQQDTGAIEGVLQDAVRNMTIRFWGLSGQGGWVEGMMRAQPKFVGKPRYKPATATEPETMRGLLVPDSEALQFEYMGINPSDAVRLLQQRGRRVPEALLTLLDTASNDSPVTTEIDWSAEAAPVSRAEVSPIPKQRRQEKKILEFLEAQGMQPLRLPDREKGKDGPKLVIKRLALLDRQLFTASSFDHAWERMRKAKEIVGAD